MTNAPEAIPASPADNAGEFTARVTSSAEVIPGKTLLTDEAMGWLAFMDRKAQLNTTWFKEEDPHIAWDNLSNGPTSVFHRYDLTYAAYALGLMSENTPAWREQYGKVLGHMADRYLEYHALWDWVECAGPDPKRAEYDPAYKAFFPEGYFGKYDLPGWPGNGLEPYAYDPDPVRGNGACNLMYKGYLNVVLSFYNYVTGDAKYDAPFKVRYDADTTYIYDHGAINRMIANQLRSNPPGIGCEVVKIYPWCHMLTGMANRLYDVMHGTEHMSAFEGWKRYFREHYITQGYTSAPIDNICLYYDPTIDANINSTDAQIAYNYFGTAAQLAPLDNELAHRLYLGGKEQFIRYAADGSAHSIGLPGMEGDYLFATITAATAAKIFGDTETFEALNQHVQNTYEPTWDAGRGEFFFHFGLGEDWPRGQLNDWLMPAYTITRPNQWQEMFTKPNTAKFTLPTLEGVDFPTLRVRQAVSDEAAFHGSFTSVDRDRLGDPTSYRITQLLPGLRYHVAVSGTPAVITEADTNGEITVQARIGTHTTVVRRLA
jgi:hypothetical protein